MVGLSREKSGTRVEAPSWEAGLAEGLSSLIANHQVNAISFEGGMLLTDENRTKILQRAEKIEESWKPLNRLRSNIKYHFENVKFDVKRLMRKLPKRKRLASTESETDIVARFSQEMEALLTPLIQDITPVSTAKALRRATEQVTVKLSITDKKVDLSAVSYDNTKESGEAWSTFFKVDHSNHEGVTIYEEGGVQKSKPAPAENKGNAAYLSLPIPESLLQNADAESFLRALQPMVPDLLRSEDAELVVTSRAYGCEIAREDGKYQVKKHKIGGDNQTVRDVEVGGLVSDFMQLLKE